MNWREEPKTSRFGSPMIPAVKQLIVFAIGWIGFRVLATTIQVLIIFISRANGWNSTEILSRFSTSMILNSVCYISMLVALTLVINTNILKLIKSFGQWQSYVAAAICLASIFAFNIVYGTFINALKELGIINIPVSDNANESSLQSLQDVYPVTCLFIFGIIGPICEELTYRVGLFSFLKRKNRFLAYFVTIAVFALIHFNYSNDPATLLNEVLNLPYYMFAAFAFSFTFDKFGFAASTTAHISNNLVSLFLVALAR